MRDEVEEALREAEGEKEPGICTLMCNADYRRSTWVC